MPDSAVSCQNADFLEPILPMPLWYSEFPELARTSYSTPTNQLVLALCLDNLPVFLASSKTLVIISKSLQTRFSSVWKSIDSAYRKDLKPFEAYPKSQVSAFTMASTDIAQRETVRNLTFVFVAYFLQKACFSGSSQHRFRRASFR